MPLLDQKSRPLQQLRISVTDRCNLRCQYCMPEKHYRWLPRESILRFEEILTLTQAFCQLGVEKVRITGGEPLLRKDLDRLIALLRAEPQIQEIAITTNATLLQRALPQCIEAGLDRVTVSLDSLDPQTAKRISQRDELPKIIANLRWFRANYPKMPLKIDTVLLKGVNDQEVPQLLGFAQEIDAEIRFIEYMDVGGATRWDQRQLLTAHQLLQSLEHQAIPLPRTDSAPALRYRLPSGQVFGIIASMSQPFCQWCDRSRITADGHWFTCLYQPQGLPLAPILRQKNFADLVQAIREGWSQREEQGALTRKKLKMRLPLFDAQTLKQQPHLEMHTRGG